MLQRISAWSRKRKIIVGGLVVLGILVVISAIGTALESEESKAAKAEATAVASIPPTPIVNCDQDCRENFATEAEVRCPSHIEDLAKYDHEWTDGILGPKFARASDLGGGLVMYSGDEVKFQNGFGAWQKMSYSCTIQVNNLAVIEVTAQ